MALLSKRHSCTIIQTILFILSFLLRLPQCARKMSRLQWLVHHFTHKYPLTELSKDQWSRLPPPTRIGKTFNKTMQPSSPRKREWLSTHSKKTVGGQFWKKKKNKLLYLPPSISTTSVKLTTIFSTGQSPRLFVVIHPIEIYNVQIHQWPTPCSHQPKSESESESESSLLLKRENMVNFEYKKGKKER